MKLVASLFLGLILLGTALVQYRAGTRERAAEAAYPPLGQFVTVEGLRVHALVTGPDDGSVPDLVLIHGSSGHVRDMAFSFIDQVKDRYRVIALDRPGMGHSDALPRGAEGIRDQARVLQAAAAALGATNPIVLGQSYGGAVALAWAVDLPTTLAAVVKLSGPSHPWDTPLSTYYKVTSHPLGQLFVVPIITAIYTEAQVDDALTGVFTPQDVPDGYRDGFGVALTMTRDRLRVNARHRALIDDDIGALHTRYGAIEVPIEILHGTADRIVWLEIHAPRLMADTAQARLTPLEGIGHMPHHVAPEAVIAGIDRAAARAGLR